jgi:hypothetical protein
MPGFADDAAKDALAPTSTPGSFGPEAARSRPCFPKIQADGTTGETWNL